MALAFIELIIKIRDEIWPDVQEKYNVIISSSTAAYSAAADAVAAKDATINALDSIVIATSSFTYIATEGQSIFVGDDADGKTLALNTESVEAFADGIKVAIASVSATEVALSIGVAQGKTVVINTDHVEFGEA